MSKKLTQERIGKISRNAYGSIMEVVEYSNANNMRVRFDQGNLKQTRWDEFLKGKVSNPYDKSVFGVGYIGEGKYNVSMNCKKTNQYMAWNSMLQRCYSEKYHKIQPTYIECSVTEEWHNFQNFGKWYDDNYYIIEGEIMQLDKDILLKNNKLYSPDNCVFVPQRINLLVIKQDARRGELPIGVGKVNEKYIASCGDGKGKTKHIRTFTSPEEAFFAYKIYKEELIKTIAEEYKDKIPAKLYNSLIKYKVEIND